MKSLLNLKHQEFLTEILSRFEKVFVGHKHLYHFIKGLLVCVEQENRRNRRAKLLYFRNYSSQLKYGVKNSKDVEAMRIIIETFISKFFVIPIYNSLERLCKRKSQTKKARLMIDDFDILIGATSIANNMVMVTNNVTHLSRLDNIIIEEWTKLKKI